MTLALPAPAALRQRDSDGVRWGIAIVVALALHGIAAIGLLRWREPVAPIAETPPATFIDLTPLPALPPSAPQQVAPSPQPSPDIRPETAPTEPVQPKAIEPPAIEPPRPVEPPAPVALPTPPPPKPLHRPAVRHRVTPPVTHEPVQQSVTPSPAAPTAAPPAPPVPAPAAPTVTTNAVPSFSALVAAQLERYKRYPALAERRGEEGIVLLRFVLDRAGNVVAAQIERSSGHALLDDEAMALVRRAAPLPAPPPEIPGDRVTLVVPISFSLRVAGG